MAKVNYVVNEQMGGIELKFDGKPETEVLASLKANGYRWSQNKGIWYTRKSDSALAFAKEICGEVVAVQTSLVGSTGSAIAPTSAPATIPSSKGNRKGKKEAKKSVKAEVKNEVKAEVEEAKNLVAFPTKADNEQIVEEAPNFTFNFDLCDCLADCEGVINGLLAKYKDSSSAYVINGLFEMCKVNNDFAHRFLAEGKTYEKAFEYVRSIAQKIATEQKSSCVAISKEDVLGYVMDYYNA